jgi:hypothetical protein
MVCSSNCFGFRLIAKRIGLQSLITGALSPPDVWVGTLAKARCRTDHRPCIGSVAVKSIPKASALSQLELGIVYVATLARVCRLSIRPHALASVPTPI